MILGKFKNVIKYGKISFQHMSTISEIMYKTIKVRTIWGRFGQHTAHHSTAHSIAQHITAQHSAANTHNTNYAS